MFLKRGRIRIRRGLKKDGVGFETLGISFGALWGDR